MINLSHSLDEPISERALDNQLSPVDIVSLELKSSQSENPWTAMAGEFKDDSLFDAVLADIEEYRRAADENK